MTLRSSCTNLS